MRLLSNGLVRRQLLQTHVCRFQMRTRFCSSIEEVKATATTDANHVDTFLHTWKSSKLGVAPKLEVFEPSKDVWPSAGFGRAKVDGALPLSEDVLFDSLDDGQLTAVIAPSDKPLYIEGAAGTGKTTVLQRRLLYLVTVKGVDPSSILTVSFSNRAAEEFRTGIRKIAPQLLPKVSISTLQSLSYAILLKHYREAGFASPPAVLADKDELMRVYCRAWFASCPKEATSILTSEIYLPFQLPEGPAGWDHPDISKLWDDVLREHERTDLSHASREAFFLSRCSFRCHSAAERLRDSSIQDKTKGFDPTSSELEESRRKTWTKYHELLCSKGVLDPDEMCVFALKLLRNQPDIAERLRDRFSYLLIDNFEDVNGTQLELCLCFNTPSITVAGDEDQRIYESRGSLRNGIDTLTKKMTKLGFGEHTRAELEINHRSSPKILNVAGSMLQPAKKFKAVKSDQHSSVLVSFSGDNTEQAEAIAVTLLVLHSGKSWNGCAILLRNFITYQAKHLKHIRTSLERHNIPYHIQVSPSDSIADSERFPELGRGLGILGRNDFKDLLAYLKLTIDVNDDEAFERALNRPPRAFLGKEFQFVPLVLDRARKGDRTMSLFDAAKKVVENPPYNVRPRALEALRDFIERVIPGSQDKSVRSVEGKLELIMELICYREFRLIELQPTHRFKKRTKRQREKLNLKPPPKPELTDLQVLLDMANVFDANCTADNPVEEFFARFNLARAPRAESKLEGAVTISNFHESKGLEWDNVFVPSFDPRLLSGPANTEFVQDEERRLYHSVCSRARNTLLQCKLVKRWKRG